MKTYTVYSEKKIDDTIQADLDIICHEILKNLMPVSILLAGSFGRGEGSILVVDGRVQPMHDYDILVIVDKKIPEQMLRKIESTIHHRFEFRQPASRESEFPEFSIHVFQTTPEDIVSYANAGSYEIKAGSRLLYGEDIRDTIPLTKNDIPVASGFHFLFQKFQMLAQFSFKNLKEAPDGMKKVNLVYQCGKTYIDMGTALSILGGFYRPSYRERNSFFPAEFEKNFPDLKKQIPDLEKKIDFFTRLKLRPDPDVINSLDPVALWFGTLQDLMTVTRYYLQTCHGKCSPDDISAFSSALYSYTRKEYFREQLGYYIRVKYGIHSNLGAILVNALYQRYTALEFYFRLKGQNRHTLHGLLETPILKFYSLTPVLLSAINQKGEVDPHLMEYFRTEFGKIVDDRPLSGHELDWDYARVSLLSASGLYSRLR
jgi:hypothetical protein